LDGSGSNGADDAGAGDGGIVEASADGCDGAPPTIGAITPDTFITFAKDVTIDITGTGFTATTTVTFNGTALATSNVTATHLSATIPAAALSSVGIFALVVRNGACSASVSVPVRNPWSIASSGWPRHHHDNQNTSVTSAVVAASPKLLWSKFTTTAAAGVQAEGGGFWSSPVVATGFGETSESVFVGGPNGDVFAFHSDGSLRYQFTGHDAAPYGVDAAGAARADANFYVGVSDANLYALAPDGTKLWSYSTGETSDASPAVLEDRTVVYASDDMKVYALRPDASVIWSSAALGEVDSALATTHQIVGEGRDALFVYAGGSNGWFRMSGKDGTVQWTVAATGVRSATVSSPVVDANGEMYGVDSGGLAVSIDATGHVTWMKQFAAGGGVTPALYKGNLHFVAGDGKLYVIRASDGMPVWSADVHGAASSASGENAVPSIDGAGNVFVYSVADGKIWRFDSMGTPLTAIVVSASMTDFVVPQVAIGAKGTLYVASPDGNMQAFQ
jgi:hypothetical protein